VADIQACVTALASGRPTIYPMKTMVLLPVYILASTVYMPSDAMMAMTEGLRFIPSGAYPATYLPAFSLLPFCSTSWKKGKLSGHATITFCVLVIARQTLWLFCSATILHR